MIFSKGLTWIISVISAMRCCLERRSVGVLPPYSVGGGALGIGRFNAVDINNKTCKNNHSLTQSHMLKIKLDKS
jgi:hypothetical protein